MSDINVILRKNFREFNKSTGQKSFLLAFILIIGIALPLMVSNGRIQILTLVGISILFLRQNISSIYVQEKEKKTMETLLSTPLTIKGLVYGAVLYHVLIALSFSAVMAALQCIVNHLLGHISHWSLQELILLISGFVITVFFVAVEGTIISIMSDNIQTASRKLSTRTYVALFYLSVCITTLEMGNVIAFNFLMFVYILIVCFIIILKLFYSAAKLTRTQIILGKKDYKRHIMSRDTQKNTKDKNYEKFSQVINIYAHEWKILQTYKRLFRHILFMVFIPSGMLVLQYSPNKSVAFGTPIIITILLVLRIPMNFIAISIGGEKAYKTFESLLSTPVSTRSMFIGKVLPSIIVSWVILICSTIVTLTFTNIINIYVAKENTLINYSLSEWVLLVGDGFLVTILMICISGFLSLMSKTPRAGLWVSVFVSIILAVPHAVIIYFFKSAMLPSCMYFLLLFIIDTFCFTFVLNNIDRKILLSRI